MGQDGGPVTPSLGIRRSRGKTGALVLGDWLKVALGRALAGLQLIGGSADVTASAGNWVNTLMF